MGLLVFVAILRWLRVRGAEATTHLDIGPSCEEVSGYCNGIVVVVGTRQCSMLLHVVWIGTEIKGSIL